MTITEERPDVAVEPPAPAARVGWRDFGFNSADHKVLGLVWMAAAAVFLFFGLIVGELVQIALAVPTHGIVGDQYGALFSLHAAGTSLLFLTPLWIGLGTYILPLQIGAPKLAMPRAHALVTWLFIMGGALFLISYLIGTPTSGGLSLSQPMHVLPGRSGDDVMAASLWVTGLLLAATSVVGASAVLLTTFVKLRVPGMTMERTPLFSWSIAATAAVTLVTTTAFMAGLIMLYLDQHYGGKFFAGDQNPVAVPIWQHTLWLFGRPDTYLILLPGLGAAADITATHFRRPLENFDVARGAMVVFGVLTLTIWTASAPAARAVLLPTPTWPTVLMGGPVLVVLLSILATARFGPPKFHISLAFVGAAFALLGVAVVFAVIAAFSTVDFGTAWTTGNIHLVLFGPPTLLALGALYHWSPKLLGRSLNQAVGGLALLLVFVGFAALGVGGYIAGYQHVPWQTLADAHLLKATSKTLNAVMAAGGILLTLGVLIVVLDSIRARFGRGPRAAGDPYDGLTLEWATTSPPPANNFDALPDVRSASPLADLREAEAAGSASAGGGA